MTNEVDDLILLLSTDWFWPCSEMLGIKLDPSVAEKLKQSFRVLAYDLMGGATNLYERSYSPARVLKTDHDLRGCIERELTSKKDRDAVLRLVQLSEEGRFVQYAPLGFVLGSIANDMSYQAELGEEVIYRLRAGVGSSGIFELEDTCLESTTPWDVQTRAWSPRLPARLATFAIEVVQIERLLEFWDWLSNDLPARQRLVVVCKNCANSVGIEQLSFPA